jgi:hypothetical protein
MTCRHSRDFARWCDDLERKYDVMPRWYWDESKRRAEFEITRRQTDEMDK